MGRTVDRGVLAGVGLVAAVLIVNAGLAYHNTRQLDEDAAWVAHTHEVLDLTGETLLALVDAETGERGFLITGKEEFLQPYHGALTRLGERVALLKRKTSDNERQQGRIRKLEAMIRTRLALLKRAIDLRRKSANQARAFAVGGKGKEQMDAIRALVAEMKGEEFRLLRDRQDRSKRAYQAAVATGLVTAAVGLASLGAFVWLLVRSLAARRRAAAAVEEQREWLRVTLASVGDAVIATDTDGRVVFLNPVAEHLTGWRRQDAGGRPLEAVFRIVNERTRQPVEDPVRRALREGRVVGLANHSVLIAKGGEERPIDDSAAPIKDEAGNCLGAVLIFRDVTERRAAEAAVRRNEERLRLALEAGRMGVWDWDVRTGAVKWSDNLEPIHGIAPGSFGGTLEAFQELVFPDDRGFVRWALTRALEEASGYDIEFRNVRPDGSVHWMAGKGKVFAEDGRPARMLGVAMDVTERKRAEQDARFLSDASAALAGLVDYESTLQKLARLAVPAFADWCAVDMLTDEGSLRRLAVAHVDPSKVELARELHRRYPPDPAAPRGVWNIVRTAKSEIVSDITDELLATVADPGLRGTLRELGLKSYMGAPLVARGRVLGVVTFIAAESGRRYEAADLRLAEDLAHRAAVAIENARLYQASREADRRKDEFLALLGHELRNPLAPIRNALHIMKMPEADDAVTGRAREIMERQVEHMARLVDDLLDVSRIMRGKVELRREPVELAAVVARAVETARPVIDAEGHELTVAVPPEPLWVDGDPVRLAQVVSNLLHNAAKYTEPGGQIRLSAAREGETTVLRVSDTGVGIAPEQLPRLFDMFFQAERRTRQSQGGLGIGLSLVKGLVELHGGSAEAHSDGPGQGSEFIVRLPLLARDEKQGDRGARGPEPVPKAAPRRVLVVDDNVDAADSLALLLRLEGQEVTVAYDGPSALERAVADPPAVAFVDLGMPKMDGYELARAFRAHPTLRSVVLVALTGWGQPEDRQRTREAGFDRHLVKPVQAKALHRLLGEPAPARAVDP
jgi:PAS domain S-box-containing protein